jgi:hypothetical protein
MLAWPPAASRGAGRRLSAVATRDKGGDAVSLAAYLFRSANPKRSA